MVEDIKVQVCRLCFALISDKKFFDINGSLKVMLQVITTDLDLDVSNSPVMCLECSKSLQEMFNFKTNFFESEEKIDSKIDNVKHKKLNLSDIMNNDFKKRPTRKSLGKAKLKNKLCRTCLETIHGNTFVSLTKNADICLASMLDSCLPELDLNLTSEPVMCQTCYKTLQKMTDFKSVCKKYESEIQAYSRRICSNLLREKVNLHSVWQFLFKSEIPEDIDVKIEPAECDKEVKNEENIDLSEENNELHDNPQYVMVKMQPNHEIGIQQVKKELKEELSGVENSLDYVVVKIQSTDEKDGIGQDEINLVTNNADIKDSFLNTAKQNPVAVKSKDNLNNSRSQSGRSSKRLKQNKDSNESGENSMIHCPDCDFKTRYKNNLRRHLVGFHERKEFIFQKKLYQCDKDKCNFATTSNIDFTRHTLSHIKSPEALQCSRCTFLTNQNSLLIKHILSHVTAENMDKYNFLRNDLD